MASNGGGKNGMNEKAGENGKNGKGKNGRAGKGKKGKGKKGVAEPAEGVACAHVGCGEPGELKCARCLAVVYCSREHQKLHWKEGGHKRRCVPAPKWGAGVPAAGAAAAAAAVAAAPTPSLAPTNRLGEPAASSQIPTDDADPVNP